jgi:hypothetical protein
MRHSSACDAFLEVMGQIVQEECGPEDLSEAPDFPDPVRGCGSRHWNGGHDFCVDCGYCLQSDEPDRTAKPMTRAELIEAMGEDEYYRWIPGENPEGYSDQRKALLATVATSDLRKMTDEARHLLIKSFEAPGAAFLSPGEVERRVTAAKQFNQ